MKNRAFEEAFEKLKQINDDESDSNRRREFEDELKEKIKFHTEEMKKKINRSQLPKFYPKDGKGLNTDPFDINSISSSRMNDFESFIKNSLPKLNTNTQKSLKNLLSGKNQILIQKYFIKSLYKNCFNVDNDFNYKKCLENTDQIYQNAIKNTYALLRKNAMSNSQIVIDKKKYNSTFNRIKPFLNKFIEQDSNILKKNTKNTNKKGGRKTRKTRKIRK